MQLVQLFVFFLVQTHFCWGQYTMVTPSQVVMAPVGSDVTLPCQVEPAADLREQVVEWGRLDLTPPYVHIRRDGLDLLMDQNPLYLARTALSESRLQKGDLSLSLSQVKLSDGGTYRCFLPRTNTEAQVTLRVDEKMESCSSCSLSWTLLALCVSANAAAAAALVVWKFRANKQKSELGEREEKESMLRREETIEDELKYLDEVIHKLSDTKTFLMKLKEPTQAALIQMNNVIDAEKNRAVLSLGIMDKKEVKKHNIDKLEGEKKVYEKTIADIDEQIVKTEEMILKSLKKRSVMEAERMNMTKFMGKEKKQQETESPQKVKEKSPKKVMEKSAEQVNNEGKTQDQNEAEIKLEGVGEDMNAFCDVEVISFKEETFGRS